MTYRGRAGAWLHLLEIKAGLFNANESKDLAWWSPEEYSDEADDYLKSLIKRISE